MTRAGRMLGLVLVASLAGMAYAAFGWWRYANMWLRDPPKISPCALASGHLLKRPSPQVSGTEPHDDVNGDTVYLTPNEDRAVRCASGISSDLAKRFTT